MLDTHSVDALMSMILVRLAALGTIEVEFRVRKSEVVGQKKSRTRPNTSPRPPGTASPRSLLPPGGPCCELGVDQEVKALCCPSRTSTSCRICLKGMAGVRDEVRLRVEVPEQLCTQQFWTSCIMMNVAPSIPAARSPSEAHSTRDAPQLAPGGAERLLERPRAVAGSQGLQGSRGVPHEPAAPSQERLEPLPDLRGRAAPSRGPWPGWPSKPQADARLWAAARVPPQPTRPPVATSTSAAGPAWATTAPSMVARLLVARRRIPCRVRSPPAVCSEKFRSVRDRGSPSALLLGGHVPEAAPQDVHGQLHQLRQRPRPDVRRVEAPAGHFVHAGVRGPSAQYARPGSSLPPPTG